jgi:hypothetical protein
VQVDCCRPDHLAHPGARLRLKFGDGGVRATADGKPASRQGTLPL